jgi:hypothetical protein
LGRCPLLVVRWWVLARAERQRDREGKEQDQAEEQGYNVADIPGAQPAESCQSHGKAKEGQHDRARAEPLPKQTSGAPAHGPRDADRQEREGNEHAEQQGDDRDEFAAMPLGERHLSLANPS